MVIDGKKLAEEILAGLKKEIKNPAPQLRGGILGAILVGNDSSSISFLKQKSKIAVILGIDFKVFRFDSKIKIEKLRQEISKLNKNKKIGGIIVQLPLPKSLNAESILKIISPSKDIDALSENPKVLAPTAEAVKFIFQKYKVSLKNKNILIVGKGKLVGQPIYKWLLSTNLSPTHRVRQIDLANPNQLPELARRADIIISGAGKAGLIKGNMIKKGAILIDFGFSKKEGKISPFDKLRTDGERSRTISGDFDFASCAKKAKLITPVPGGMGPVMVAMLFYNLFKLSKK